MSQEYSRAQRVGDALRRELAVLIQQEVRDPRVGMVSVTDVEVSRDLAHARVYVTLVGRDREDAGEAVAALNHAAGYLRSLLARHSHRRTTPQLRFLFDDSVARGAALEALIERAVDEDRRHPDDETGEQFGTTASRKTD